MKHRVRRRLRLKNDPLSKVAQVETASYNGYTISVVDGAAERRFVYNRRPPEVILRILEMWKSTGSALPLQEFIELTLSEVDPDDI